MIISLDTECTGLDLVHGAKPFLVTSCDDSGSIRFWEWDVDPLTRQPQIPDGDVADVVELLDAADLIYMQNAKYDARVLATIGVELPWPKVRDTLAMGHLLASNHRHDLTWMCIEYLGMDIEPHEVRVREVTQACRAICKRDFPHWRIAEEGLPEMPSVKASSKRDEDKPWKNDMWLPRALARELGGKVSSFRLSDNTIPNHNWLDACSRYANSDSEHTLPLGIEMERLIRERGYWNIYEKHRVHLPQVSCEMESFGVTAIGDYTAATMVEYRQHVAEAEEALISIASEYGHELQLAEGASLNDNMRDFFYGAKWDECPVCGYSKRVKHWNDEGELEGRACPKCEKPKRKKPGSLVSLVRKERDNLNLRVITSKKTGNASLDKDAMQDYVTTLDEGPALDFMELLSDKRMYDTALTYLESYARFWVAVPNARGYYRIHGSLNPFGTDHLRWAGNSPNMQNVSGESKEISNRAVFGPLPTREWWRMDYKSIERRIPPYECLLLFGEGDRKMLEVFERPDKPPYWGSLYLLTASVLYPKQFNDEVCPKCLSVEGEECEVCLPPVAISSIEGAFRKKYPRLYKQAKFFDLAKQYGCGRRKGDLLSRIKDSFDLVDSEFPILARLQAKYLADAERLGYVETVPDRDVDPTRGYPVLASRTDDGRVLSTTPFNYHTSGTACWAKNKALVRCAVEMRKWRADGFDAHIALEVHDEILFDFPRGATMEENIGRAMVLKGLMERSGDDIGIPTPVSVEYHTHSWADGVAVA